MNGELKKKHKYQQKKEKNPRTSKSIDPTRNAGERCVDKFENIYDTAETNNVYLFLGIIFTQFSVFAMSCFAVSFQTKKLSLLLSLRF